MHTPANIRTRADFVQWRTHAKPGEMALYASRQQLNPEVAVEQSILNSQLRLLLTDDGWLVTAARHKAKPTDTRERRLTRTTGDATSSRPKLAWERTVVTSPPTEGRGNPWRVYWDRTRASRWRNNCARKVSTSTSEETAT